jgi:hypothetical protein
VDGESFFNKAFTHPADASKTINVDISPRLLVFAIDFAIVVLSLIFAMSVSGSMGHLSPFQVWRLVWNRGPTFWC